MKPVRQKRQEALERRKKDLVKYQHTEATYDYYTKDGRLLENAERTAHLTRKMEICKADISKLESILESSY